MWFKIYLVVCMILILCLIYHFLTKKYVNPYKLIFIFGKKGSGKSTLLTKFALKYEKEGRKVYSTEPIPGTYSLTVSAIGRKQFEPGSVIIIDEVGTIWDNRNFKNFSPEVRDFFKYQRHARLTVILASQTFDIDKKIRDLTDEMYLVEKKFRVFSYAKKVLKKLVLVEASAESPSKIDENLVFDSLLFFWAGSRKLTFIPNYINYFDSFALEPKPAYHGDYIPPIESSHHKLLPRLHKRHK